MDVKSDRGVGGSWTHDEMSVRGIAYEINCKAIVRPFEHSKGFAEA